MFKKVDQTKLHDPANGVKGNCLAACVASLFGVDIDQVPAFEEGFDDGSWLQEFEQFLNARGYEYNGCHNMVEVLASDHMSMVDGLMIAYGPSPRNPKILHAIVCDQCSMVHDPHPSRDWVLAIDGFYLIDKVEPPAPGGAGKG